MTATFIRAKTSLLNGRIDAMYYRPEFVQNAERLRNSQLRIRTLKELTHSGRRAVYFSTSTRDRGVAPEDWVPFLTADDFGADGFDLNLNARRFVAPEFADRYPNGQLRANELLVKVKGPNQITAYCEHTPDRRVLVSGTIWGALVRKERIDPHYLVAALSSEYAVLARSRLRTNLNVEFLSPTDLLSLELPVPKELDAHVYVGDKVRQAARLRAHACNIIDQVEGLHLQLIPGRGYIESTKKMRRVPNTVLTERLDAHFYPAAVSEYFERSRITEKNLKTVCFAIANGATQSEASDSKWHQATVANLSGMFIHGGFRRIVRPAGSCQTFRTHDLAFCNAAHSKDYIGREISYCDEAVDGVYPSTEVMLVRVNRDELPASYVRAFLSTTIGFIQFQSTIRGITAHCYPSDVKTIRIPIPVVPKELETRFKKSDEQMLVAGRCIRCAESLVAGSKTLVEALISGHLTDADLANARTQLEQGNEISDRTILSRMYEGGIDATDTKPLFPDLDTHYETLQLAHESEQDGGSE